jgi:hypothetical protein
MSKYSEKQAQAPVVGKTIKAHVSPAPKDPNSLRSKRRANRGFDGVTKAMRRAAKFPKLSNGK